MHGRELMKNARLSEPKRSKFVKGHRMSVFIEYIEGGARGGEKWPVVPHVQDTWPDPQMRPGLSKQGPWTCDVLVLLKFKKI